MLLIVAKGYMAKDDVVGHQVYGACCWPGVG